MEALAQATGEVVVSGGAAAAHGLGLTRQVPVRAVYLTSGATREGEVLRALEWIGREAVGHQVAERAVESLGPEERERLMLACASAPSWLSRVITGALFPAEREGATLENA